MKEYIIRSLIIVAISAPLYALIRKPFKRNDKREIPIMLFVLYLICLIVFTLEGRYATPIEMLRTGISRMKTGEYVNLVPFGTISYFRSMRMTDAFWINIISNIVIFIPWGFFLPLLWKKFRSIPLHLLMCLAITLFIEFYQLFIWRNTDIDDVMLNFVGGVMGELFYLIFKKICNMRQKNKSQKGRPA